MKGLSNRSQHLKWGFCLGFLCLFSLAFGPLVRERSSRPTCVQNMRRLGQALALYTADNDGFLPSEGALRTRKISSLPLPGCPLAPDVNGEGIPGYAFNYAMRHGLVSSKIAYPAQTIAVCEEPVGVMFTSTVNPYQEYPEGTVAYERSWERHAGAGHYLFFDGHVQRLKSEQIMTNHQAELGNTGAVPSFAITSRTELRKQASRQFGTQP